MGSLQWAAYNGELRSWEPTSKYVVVSDKELVRDQNYPMSLGTQNGARASDNYAITLQSVLTAECSQVLPSPTKCGECFHPSTNVSAIKSAIKSTKNLFKHWQLQSDFY